MLMGVREQLVRRRTQVANAIRGYAAEFGLIAAKGLDKIGPLIERVAAEPTLPELAREMFAVLATEYGALQARLRALDAGWRLGSGTMR
jgi:transposase